MYTSALHLTNDALRNPEIAVTDATLISVLSLGLYEVRLYILCDRFLCAELTLSRPIRVMRLLQCELG